MTPCPDRKLALLWLRVLTILLQFICTFYSLHCLARSFDTGAQASSSMETDGTDAPAESPAASSSAVGLLPELEIYAYLLVVTFLVDKKLYPEVYARPPCVNQRGRFKNEVSKHPTCPLR